jgi:hypothetical protein
MPIKTEYSAVNPSTVKEEDTSLKSFAEAIASDVIDTIPSEEHGKFLAQLRSVLMGFHVARIKEAEEILKRANENYESL